WISTTHGPPATRATEPASIPTRARVLPRSAACPTFRPTGHCAASPRRRFRTSPRCASTTRIPSRAAAATPRASTSGRDAAEPRARRAARRGLASASAAARPATPALDLNAGLGIGADDLRERLVDVDLGRAVLRDLVEARLRRIAALARAAHVRAL